MLGPTYPYPLVISTIFTKDEPKFEAQKDYIHTRERIRQGVDHHSLAKRKEENKRPHECLTKLYSWLLQDEELKHTLTRKDHKLVYVYDGNLSDEIWKDDRPQSPTSPVRVHDMKYVGSDVSSKFIYLRRNLIEFLANSIGISMLDEVS
jgi:hypothetical protein